VPHRLYKPLITDASPFTGAWTDLDVVRHAAAQ
jgi:hypothetical protein